MRRPGLRLAILGATLVVLVGVGLAILGGIAVGDDRRTVAFATTILLGGVVWLLAVLVVRSGNLPRWTMWVVFIVAVVMRLMTLAAPPFLSSDLYRYVWDGRVQLAGINPYRYLPIAEPLASLRDDAVYPHINRAEYAHTVYPPAAQAIFALAAVVTPGVFGMKLMIAAFDVLAIAALYVLLRIAGRHPAELLIYAWLPLPVWEFEGNAHIDGAAAGLLAVALLLAARGRSVCTGIVLAAATLTKLLPAVVFAAFWRAHRWRLLIAGLLTVIVFYLPYCAIGWRAFGFLPDYFAEEGFANGQGVFALQLLGKIAVPPSWAPGAYIALVLAVLGLLGARYAWFTELPTAPGPRLLVQARQALVLGAVLLIAASPHYPWYLGWLAPFATLAPLPSVLWMLAAAPLLAHGAFEDLAIPALVYGGGVVVAAFDFCCRRTRRLRMHPQAVRSLQ
jgi:hypothetical protein